VLAADDATTIKQRDREVAVRHGPSTARARSC
jgi:hypothetical protein